MRCSISSGYLDNLNVSLVFEMSGFKYACVKNGISLKSLILLKFTFISIVIATIPFDVVSAQEDRKEESVQQLELAQCVGNKEATTVIYDPPHYSYVYFCGFKLLVCLSDDTVV